MIFKSAMVAIKRLLSFLLLVYLVEAQDYEFGVDFKFGVATSAYQVEGAWDVGEKGASIWDWMTHTYPNYIADGSNADDTCRAYYKTSEDVELLKELGVDFYRFSISWSRLFPTGHTYYVSEDGLRYYNELIDELSANNIIPIVTMFHWDLPLAMHEIGGWTNPLMANYFVDYAQKLFEFFGDRVKYWITFNEPYQFCHQGYSSGGLAPAYVQDGYGGYLCGHTVLLAHARTFKLFNEQFRYNITGQVGITLDSLWFEPEEEDDPLAAETSMQMMLGWFAHPIFSSAGDYPPIMKERINALSEEEGFRRSRLPAFTSEEVDLIRGSADFFGLNHYTSAICRNATESQFPTPSLNKDTGAYCYKPDDWDTAASSWLKVVPWGFRKLLNWIRRAYGNPPVFVTENGYSDSTGTLNDCKRVDFYNDYMEALLGAIVEDNCRVVAYTAWSFLDNFEWTQGYREKFGLHYVNFNDPDRERTPKRSAKVFTNTIQTRKIDRSYIPDGFEVCGDEEEEYTFPPDFKFGVATASYQVEGAYNEGGKGENIWDYLTNNNPHLITDGSNGNIACDAYHKTSEDVQLLSDLGVDFYRFSISWSRILPGGHANYTNSEGIDYYNGLIDTLLANGINPVVTMFHWDLPQPLQEIGGWPSPMLVDTFEDYADILFSNFGDRVKQWITFNEPYQICAEGYSHGGLAPAYTQEGIGGYLCGHTVLLAHARAYRLYESNYKASQNGKVGITVHGLWAEPETDSAADREAANTHIQMHFGWFLHPIFSTTGDYPEVMKARVEAMSEEEGFSRSRLPVFTNAEIEMIRGSADFLGFNHYTSTVCSGVGTNEADRPSHVADRGGRCFIPSEWEHAASPWLYVVPWGFRKMLKWIKDEYNNPEVMVTENGYSDTGGSNDCNRIEYLNQYLEALLEAIHEDECNVIAYTAWSFMDNFEWMKGYTERFGLYAVDFDDPNRERSPKMSSYVFSNIISTRRIDWNYIPEDFDACQW